LIPADQWNVRYEQLREQAMKPSTGQHGKWGLLLFLRHGLVAWMRAWPQTSSPERREEATRNEPEERMRFSTGVRDEVISVLVNMVLHKQEEVLA
jgi:hypothetical protein